MVLFLYVGDSDQYNFYREEMILLNLNFIKNKFNKITSYKYFDEIYVIIICIIALMGWGANTIVGMSIILISAALMLLLTDDLKYVIPNTIYMIFTINDGFSNAELPIPIIVT